MVNKSRCAVALVVVGACFIACGDSSTPTVDELVVATPLSEPSSLSESPVGTPIKEVLGKPASLKPQLLHPVHNADGYPGYRHDPAKSRFDLGVESSRTTFPGGEGTTSVGTEGVLTEWANGFMIAQSRPKSANRAGPLTNDPAVHHARTRSYFESAGLPLNQVGGVDISTDIEEGADPSGTIVHHEFIGYTSSLRRRVEGTLVSDSFAFAQFNRNDKVVYEGVWWPALPITLKDDVAAFRALLADVGASASLQAKLPEGLDIERGQLNIHHPPPHGRAWYAVVTLDFAVPKSPRVWHFDVDGNSVRFEAETAR